MAADRTGPPPAPRLANLLWLDFVNTRFTHRDQAVDAIPTPKALTHWLAGAGLLPGSAPGRLAALRGAGGGRLLSEAHVLRGALAALAGGLSRGEPPPRATIRAINRVLRAAPAHHEIRAAGGLFERRTIPSSRDPLALLAPLAESAAAFVIEGDRARLRACGNPKCVLFFYDLTRNGRRRFCSAAGCGNRVKAARRYRRLRARESG